MPDACWDVGVLRRHRSPSLALYLSTMAAAYNSQYLETYDGHFMAVYGVRWNKFHQRVFLSASADWTGL